MRLRSGAIFSARSRRSKSKESKITEEEKIRSLLKELNIKGEVVKDNDKLKVIVASLSDAFKLYRYGFYDVEIDESKSLIKRKK